MREVVMIFMFVAMIITLVVVPIYGWISNFVKFVQADFSPPYKLEVLRGIGVITVIPGVIMGFIEIQDD